MWAPGRQKPLEMALAVDLNNNARATRRAGHRAAARAVQRSRQGRQGRTRTNPATTRSTTPTRRATTTIRSTTRLGTEGNQLWDEGEPFVGHRPRRRSSCPTTGTCTFDVGDGQRQVRTCRRGSRPSSRATAACRRGYKFAQNARPAAPGTTRRTTTLDYYSDGGIPRHLQLGAVGYHYMGAFRREEPSSVYFNDWEFLPNAISRSALSR